MTLELLVDQITESAQDLFCVLKEGVSGINLSLRRSAHLPMVAALQNNLNRPCLVVTDRTDRALTIIDELGLLTPSSSRFFYPEPNPIFYENSPWGEKTRRDRIAILTNLASYHIPGLQDTARPPLIITSARALMTRTIPRREFLKAMKTLKIGEAIPMGKFVRKLTSLGYESTSTVISPGQFAHRGGILDIWCPSDTHPTRIEFFGDSIDTLRKFDPSTQRSFVQKDQDLRLLLTPAREYIIKEGENFSGAEYQVPSEFLIPILHKIPSSILDYLPRNTLVIIDNLDDLRSTVNSVEEQSFGLREDLIKEGSLPIDFPVPYLTWPEIEDSLHSHQILLLGPTLAEEQSSISRRFNPGPRFAGRLKPLLENLTQLSNQGHTIFVVSRQTSRLHELWDDQYHQPSSLATSPYFIEGSLTEGWEFIPVSGPPVHLFTDGEIFGWRRPEPRQRQSITASAPEALYADLQPGDWVVHVDHGIGIFLGLVNRSVDSIQREYLAIEYAEGDQLFVPVHQADRLTRYIGYSNRPPTPSRLGSSEWRNVKVRVKEAVREVANDLLDLYAKRQITLGHSFSPDSPWQQELESSFPYIETDDQLMVMKEVKRDMESSRPMDRLICGDVGYGKTEIALRASFKAIMDGRQVAILVPTTILAQQHYNTFRQRLAAFPAEVEMLSRFRTSQQQREILLRLEIGGIDIIIGTHRLLQSDVKFKDLGLLIIDEEQRFGVFHKEFLKQMRAEVDVLTLTATPIPRTLYMALTGIRDISTINTPPEERLPVITHVGPYSKRLVRQAILRELERGGQVFFVHNRVQTIPAMHAHLKRLVPEARITIAHGQMPEKELAQRMEQFANGTVDVLLSTVIIEAGLDIPNANTLMVNRADAFGLAQLYQLRGRVGRGAQRAYAYFFKHPRKPPSIEGRQRLETIAENTQLGAGFSIAMRDLEIRGTGDILGTRQHGHIASIGFHLYTRLLGETISNVRSERGLFTETAQDSFDIYSPLVNVDLPLQIGIPIDYIPEKHMRLNLYRRIANLRSLTEVEKLEEEFFDRFGQLPKEVQNLLFQMKVKILAVNAGLASVNLENNQISLRFRNGEVPSDVDSQDLNLRIGKTALWLPCVDEHIWTANLVKILQTLNNDIQISENSL
ncbi:MAG: transcription-repair coupling factor [Anaerolineales bacterium]|nr:transcription-repair coupling factor [Anaerolineales bacterium]